jgi:hypothetical protein
VAPPQPKLYHITHIDNLVSIVESGYLYSDSARLQQGLAHHNIGMSEIKQQRLARREVHCHPGTWVGDYVPFYFCPRSIMLYLLHKGNHPGLDYHGGQRPIVHLQLDLHSVVQYCQANGLAWAFTDRNAGSAYARFFNRLEDLDQVDWKAVQATDFRSAVVKEGKQAEWLVHQRLPWTLVELIGVIDREIATAVVDRLGFAEHRPRLVVKRAWYFP